MGVAMGRGLRAVVLGVVVFFSACAGPVDPGADSAIEEVPREEAPETPASGEPPSPPPAESSTPTPPATTPPERPHTHLVPPPRNVTFSPSIVGGTLGWEAPEATSAPVTDWSIRVGPYTNFSVPGHQRSATLHIPWGEPVRVEIRAVSRLGVSEPVVLTGLRGTEPVHMSAWVLTGGDAQRHVRLRLWRSEPVEVRLKAEMNRQPASLGAALPDTLRVGPEPVTLDVPWNVGRDCQGDRADISFTAQQGEERVGTASATAWLRACAATGMTSLLDTGEWPSALQSADLDGDGRPELIVAHYGAPALLVLFPGPDGYGYRRRYVHVGRPSDWMLVRDLDGDGRSDVVLLQRGSGEVLVLLGDRERLFAPPRAFELGGPAESVAFADVDADGQSDIIALDREAHRYRVLAGRCDGTFTALASGEAPLAATALLVGHLTEDRYPDLAYRGANLLAVGDGAGHFVPSHSVEQRLDFDSADADGDGAPELLALDANGVTMRLHALHVDAGGALSRRLLTTSTDAELYPSRHALGSTLRIADFNGDGRRDFLFLSSASGRSSICLQNADGTCSGNGPSHGECHDARDALSLDVDGDALPELIFAVDPGCAFSGYLSTYRLRGSTRTSSAILLVENPVSDVAFLDSNADGVKEVVIGAHDVTLLGGAGAKDDAAHFDVGGWVRALATGDFNGDGLVDIAALNERREVYLLVGRGGGRFERTKSPLATLPPGRESRWPWEARLHAGDFNRDGREDLLVTSISLGVTLLTSAGQEFTPSKPFGEVFGRGVVGELNGDGWLDVVLGTGSYLGRPDGSFAEAWTAPTQLFPLVLRDLNGDGLLDLTSGTDVFIGQGSGHFRWMKESPPVDPAYGLFVAAGDWNGDGLTDLLSAESTGLSEGSSKPFFQGQDHRFRETGLNLSRYAVTGAWATDLEGDAQDEFLIANAHTYEPYAYWRLELFRLPRAP